MSPVIATNLVPLVTAMAAGDQSAMGQLYDLTSGLIHGMALRMLENPQDAEEVVLDVYMKAWRNAAHYSVERGSVNAWLIMMTRTVAIDRIRSRNAQPRTLDLGAPELPEPRAPGVTPEESTAQRQWRARVEGAMRELPEEQREALLLAFFGGLSHAELAERLGQPLGTIKTRIRLGLRRLKTLLGESAAFA
ncbi:MAG: sigma-70 family RNA polymerase sigma factor [Bryobacteraceae bacterium]|nr:sigma-70 family RNA polymerase sigma factor [Bryobacteraceae bacterium]